MTRCDYILEISFDAPDLEDLVQSRLFLTASIGSVADDGMVSAYFASAEDRAAAAEALRGIEGIELREVERERVNWLEKYEQSLEPIVIGERFVVAPDASLLPGAGSRLAIVVPQEQAFGTGSHETTALCIELLETMAIKGVRCLDIGAGSGILAIAMVRLGASRVIALDNDLDAYAALRENRLRNAIEPDVMPLFIGSIASLHRGRFDVVTMNIVPEVIIPMLPEVTEHLAAGANLVISGVLLAAREGILQACAAQGLAIIREAEKGEWWAAQVSS